LSEAGVRMNCVPCVDLRHAETASFLADRPYGARIEQVTALGRQVCAGSRAGGVLPILKHMPGHGRSAQDTHFDLPRVTADLQTLRDTDFAPFRALRDLPMGMTAHLVYEAIALEPATLSPEVVGVLRQDIGFDGLLMTDDLSMKALSGAAPERARRARAAGVDAILFCNASLADRVAVAEAAGRMDDAAQRRAEAALDQRRTPAPLDIEAAEAELSVLMDGQVYG
jgi:beta-N-acetylhexosaminidase